MLSVREVIRKGRGQVRDALEDIQHLADASREEAHVRGMLQALRGQEPGEGKDKRHKAVPPRLQAQFCEGHSERRENKELAAARLRFLHSKAAAPLDQSVF